MANGFSQSDDVFDKNYSLLKVFSSRLSGIKKIGIAPVYFDCYYLTAGGIREYNDSSSIAAIDLILNNLKNGLVDKMYTVNQYSNDSTVNEQFKKFKKFYDVINSQITYNIYGVNAFQKRKELITYTFPPMEDLFSHLDIDALLLISGFDDQSTDRRRKLKAGAVAGAIVGAIAAAFVGIGGYTVIPDDQTYLNAVMVDRKGEILWYNTVRQNGYNDMNDPKVVDKFVGNLLNSVKSSK